MLGISIKDAEELLRKRYCTAIQSTDYILAFRTSRGRELALERERSDSYFLWLQKYNQDFDGVSIRNLHGGDGPYSASQTRNSNLNTTKTPKLGIGNRVWYLEIDSLEALDNVLSWYETQ